MRTKLLKKLKNHEWIYILQVIKVKENKNRN